MSTNALKAWSMDAGPTGPAVKAVLPPHKGGPSLGATSPAAKQQTIPEGMTAEKAAHEFLAAIKAGDIVGQLKWAQVAELCVVGQASQAVTTALANVFKTFQDASVGLDFATAFSTQASRTFEEPLMVLADGEHEMRLTIERRPIRPAVKAMTLKPAPVEAGVSKSAAGNAPEDNIRKTEAADAQEEAEIAACEAACDAEEKKLGRKLTAAEEEQITEFTLLALMEAATMPDPE